ncbi:MAG: phosphate acetyltransferase [Caldicoprobacterales bacterium]|nr:phosphate acetyltransferase [Clostridiales bacterium]
MGVINDIIKKAKACKKTIVLPESDDIRMLEASQKIVSCGIADIVLLGNEEVIREKAGDIDLSGVKIIDPLKSENVDTYVEALVELRKHKGMTLEKAKEAIKDPLYFGCMMVKLGDADGMVAGAVNSTPDVWRPVLQIIKTRPGISIASSCFLMEVPDCQYGENGVFIYADCGLNPDPTPEDLASIAISAAESARILADMEPRIAMLSFSTKGSASHESVDKVVEATRIAKEMAPDLLIDGELQGDAALDPDIGQQKSPGSPVAGRANVLIFPDLGAGNIAYKLTERLAKATALGPLSQGLAKPVNDLSRGCSVDDIVNVVAITALEAQN